MPFKRSTGLSHIPMFGMILIILSGFRESGWIIFLFLEDFEANGIFENGFMD